MPRALGVDPGEKRIGLALSDELGVLASPTGVIARTSTRAAVARIAEFIARNEVVEVIVGVPISLSGELGPQAQRSLRFARELGNAVPVPVVLWNEQYSTREAERRLRAVGPKRQLGSRSLDAASAAVLLQDYLDSRR